MTARLGSWVRPAVSGIMAAGLLAVGALEEGHATNAFARYQSSKPQLPVSFEYPEGWRLEESAGTHEAYAQVQLFGPDSLDARMRTYVVVRAIPLKAAGGRYESLEELVDSYRKTLQAGLRIDGESPATVWGVSAMQLDVSGVLWLPWKAVHPQPVPVKSQRIFVESGGRFFELGWMATPESAETVSSVFAHVLQTLAPAP